MYVYVYVYICVYYIYIYICIQVAVIIWYIKNKFDHKRWCRGGAEGVCVFWEPRVVHWAHELSFSWSRCAVAVMNTQSTLLDIGEGPPLY